MLPLKIAIASDIHAGQSARPRELRGPKAYAGDGEYLDHFRAILQQEGLSADYLVIPGDLTDTGQHEEARTASEVIRELCEAWQIQKDRLIVVPGNHDVNRQAKTVGNATDREFWRQFQFAALSDPKLFFADRMAIGSYNLCIDPHLAIWNLPEVDFVVYNSAAFEDEDASTPRHGRVVPDAIVAIDAYFRPRQAADDHLRVFVTHHHPIEYTDEDPDWVDFSMMHGSADLLRCLTTHSFDIFIHGHKHLPRCRSHTD